MALEPHSEDPHLGMPEDYARVHPTERPSDWGWHGEWGRTARVAGWIVAVILLLMITATHYNFSGAAWLIAIAAGLVTALTWDTHRRWDSWRPR